MSALNFVIILLCVIVSSLCIALKLLIADFREVRIKVLKLETFIEADDFADEFVNGLKDLHIDADLKTEPTISKMEQVEDEPQITMDCSKCERYKDGGELCDFCAIKDEPQTDTEIAKAIVHKMIDDAVIAEDAYPDLRQKMHDAVDEYEPQTERSK